MKLELGDFMLGQKVLVKDKVVKPVVFEDCYFEIFYDNYKFKMNKKDNYKLANNLESEILHNTDFVVTYILGKTRINLGLT